MTLRRRLVLLVVGLSVVGLVVSGLVGTLLLRSFALNRVDRQLAGGFGPPRFGNRPGGRVTGLIAEQLCHQPFQFNPQGILTEFYKRDGSALCTAQSVSDPGGGPVLSARDLARAAGSIFSVGGRKGGSYRVVVSSLDETITVVRAIDLREATSLWHDQALAVSVLTALTLAAIGGAGAWLVRRDLRPLDDVTHTADAIAQGDRTQRVDVTAPGTEVGRLGTAFNTMLASIDASFVEQQRSEEKLRAFVADASHELRTPLTSILGYAELQLAGAADSPEKLATSMRNIRREGLRMSGLVEDLLLLARFDQEPKLQPSRVLLDRLVDAAALDLRAVAPDRPVTVAASSGVVVYGDEARLRQVVANLVTNARSHTPAGTPIEISVEPAPHGAVVRVVDHGPGIPGEYATKVFERFARLDPSRARASGGGAGLGLAIVKAIVDAHDGRVQVIPTPGGGATFVVALPTAVPATVAER